MCIDINLWCACELSCVLALYIELCIIKQYIQLSDLIISGTTESKTTKCSTTDQIIAVANGNLHPNG